MSYTGYLDQTIADMRFISIETQGNTCRPLRIILSDCVTPEIRSRKHFIEFPTGIDSIGQSLMRLGYTVDFAFLPQKEIRHEMRFSGESLQTLGLFGNHRIPVRQANIIGISLMNYLQTPYFFTLLSLSNIPLYRMDRTALDPLIVLGGHIWPNPLPLSHFFEVMVIGDGEDVMPAIAQCIAANKGSREEQCTAIASIPGAYVPGHTRGPVRKAIVDFADVKYASGSSIVKDSTAAIILSRGCTHACAFCNSGHVGGPYRVKPYPQLIQRIDRLSRAGARRIMLCATAAASYKWEYRSLSDIVKEAVSRGLEVRGMSDRPESFDADHLKKTAKLIGKVSIAIEAHPELRKKVLLKNLAEEDIRHAIEQCIKARVEQIQFYAILAIPPISPGIVDHLPAGFAGENDSHLRYLADIASSTVDLMRKSGMERRNDQPSVIFDCMPLIPAIGTMLQCISFPRWSEYLRQMERLDSMLSIDAGDSIKVTAGLDELSYLLQMILERSGPFAGSLILSAFHKADFDVPTPEMVHAALDEFNLDLSSFQKEIPADRLPYAGLIF